MASNELTKFHNWLVGLSLLCLLCLLYVSTRYDYLLFHALAETFSVVVAVAVFMLVWSLRHLMQSGYFRVLGVAFLFVGVLDFLHTLAYKGMPIFKGYDSNLPTQLWIAARYLQVLSFLAAGLLLRHKPDLDSLLAVFSGIFVLLVTAIFTGYFPDCLIDGRLTNFKIFSEYLISALCGVAIYQVQAQRAAFDEHIRGYISLALALNIASELSFTLYTDVYGFFNMLGHFFKIISFYLIYKVIIESNVQQPYTLMFHELEHHRRMLETLFSNLPGMAYRSINDEHFTMKLVSDGCLELTGYRREDLIDNRVVGYAQLIHPEDLRSICQTCDEALRKGQAFELIYRIRTAQGEEKWVWEKGRGVSRPGESSLMLEGFISDITDLKNAEQAIREEKELNQFKTHFIAMVSHEFRTPMATISSAAGILRRYWPRLSEAEKVGYLNDINSEIKHMNNMLEEVSMLGRADAGKLHCRPQRLLVCQACRDILQRVRALDQEQHRFEFICPSESKEITVDHNLLEHILINLLTNAMKYSPANSEIRLEVEILPDVVRFHIQDQGIGIPEVEQATLFEAFQRGSNTAGIAGSGLGLTVVKQCVDLHGGSIEVHSRPHQGSRFSVSLPFT